MHYVRFLKPPKATYAGKSLQSLTAIIVVTTDLGESAYEGDIQLVAKIYSQGELFSQQPCQWRYGMHGLQINFDVTSVLQRKPTTITVRIELSGQVEQSSLADALWSEDKSKSRLSIVTVESSPIHLRSKQEQAMKRVLRSLKLKNAQESGEDLSIWEDTGESIARHIWDAGLALTACLDWLPSYQTEHQLRDLQQLLRPANPMPLRVIELGCGCGLVGLGLAKVRSKCNVLLTDLPEAQEIVELNLKSNTFAPDSHAEFLPLNWDECIPKTRNQFFEALDIIMLSDCTYNPDSSPSLVRTISALTNASRQALVIVAMKVRHASEAIFFDLMSEHKLVQVGQSSVALPTFESSLQHYEPEQAHVYLFKKARSG